MKGYRRIFCREKMPYVLLTAAAAVLLYRCFFSFVWSDESFYLSLVHRFWAGDAPIVDEWSGVQFYAVILLPVYSLYRLLVGSSDGVYLFFRILAVVSQYALSLYIFRTLCRISARGPAFLGALSFLLYTRANIHGASYYSFSLLFFTWSLFLIWNAQYGNTRRNLGMAGAAMALAVLAMPYLAVIYILVMILIGIVPCLKKFRGSVGWMALGTFLCALPYCAFLLSRAGMGELWENIPHLLSDAEHENSGIIVSIIFWAARIGYRYRYTAPAAFLCLIYGIFRIKKEKWLNDKTDFAYVIINLIIFAIDIKVSDNMIGCVNIAISILAIKLYFLMMISGKLHLQKSLCLLFASGLLFSMIFHFGSNTGLDSMTIGFTICAVVSPVMVWESLRSFRIDDRKKRRLCAAAVILFAAAALQSGWLRLFGVYRDGAMSELRVQLTDGPGKYLYTTEEHAVQYRNLAETVGRTCPKGDDLRVVFIEMAPWAYLCVDAPCGAPSPCRFWGGLSPENLQEYYEEDPERFPDYVCDLAPEYGSFRSVHIQGKEESAAPNGTDAGQWLIEAVREQGYAAEKTACGVIYTRK